jgi:hypothetical protein
LRRILDKLRRIETWWFSPQDKGILYDVCSFDPGGMAPTFPLTVLDKSPWHHDDVSRRWIHHETERHGIPEWQSGSKAGDGALDVLDGERARRIFAYET